jgi:hypothetical protein
VPYRLYAFGLQSFDNFATVAHIGTSDNTNGCTGRVVDLKCFSLISAGAKGLHDLAQDRAMPVCFAFLNKFTGVATARTAFLNYTSSRTSRVFSE